MARLLRSAWSWTCGHPQCRGLDRGALRLSVLVRKARLEDLPVAAVLYQSVLRETFTWISAWRHQARDFLRSAREEDVYVAVTAGEIVGVAGFFVADNFLHSLYVSKRGLGIGQAILNHILAEATGPVTLKCQTANLRAQAFYVREGFVALELGQDPPGPPWVRMLRTKTD